MVKIAVILAGALASSAHAHADPCAGEAVRLRAQLVRDAEATRRWNLEWGLGFTAIAAGAGALAIVPTLDAESRDSMLVSAAKSAIGALSHVVTPLRIELPAQREDACADLAALREAVARTARHERGTFWLDHAGALVLNLGGALVLAELHRWQTGAVSFALGYPVALLHVYTLPRGTWHLEAAIGAGTVGVRGSF